jgi:DNA-binding transcriptional ArsR family regulator
MNDIKRKIKEYTQSLYDECFDRVESVILDDGIDLDDFKCSQSRPMPYIRTIYTKYLKDKGIPVCFISKRLGMSHCTLSQHLLSFKDNCKYIPEFRELAVDLIRKFKLKDIENGTTQL